MKLRTYQSEALRAVDAAYDAGSQSVMVLMATGLGKTVLFAHAADHRAKHGRVMVVAHRSELLAQASAKIEAVTGQLAEIEQAGQWANHSANLGWSSPFIVASIQSLTSGPAERRRMHRFDPTDFSLLVIDEGHHAAAPTYRECIEWFTRNPDLRVLLVTATGDRGDGIGLHCVCEQVVYRYELPQAVRDGWLVPVRQRSVVVEGLDFSKCRTTAGDLNQADLAEVMEFEANLHPVAHATIESACGLPIGTLHELRDDPQRRDKLAALIGDRRIRRTLVFTASVAHAERLAEIFDRWVNGSAKMVCGTTHPDERARIIGGFASGEFPILVNVAVATEGFDVPAVELVVMARPTKSRAVAVQQIGRGTRPAQSIAGTLGELPDAAARVAMIAASEKPNCEILDFVGNCGRHSLVGPIDIMAGEDADPLVVRRAKEIAQGESVDAAEALRRAEEEVDEQLEIEQLFAEAEARRLDEEDERRLIAELSRRTPVVATAHYQIEEVGDGEVHAASGPERVATIKRDTGHGREGATEGQVRYILSLSRQCGGNWTAEKAERLGKRAASGVIGKLKEQVDAARSQAVGA